MDNVENIVVEHLKALRSELREFRGDVGEQFKELKHRVSQLEALVLGSRRDTVSVHEDVFRQQGVIDRLAERIERIEKRLELLD
jgi:hypothetical protein